MKNNSTLFEEQLKVTISRTNRSLFFFQKYREITDCVVFSPIKPLLKLYSFLNLVILASLFPVVFTLIFEPLLRKNLLEKTMLCYITLFSISLLLNFFQKKSVLKKLQVFIKQEVIDFNQSPYNKDYLSVEEINSLLANEKTSQEAKDFAQALSSLVKKQSIFHFDTLYFKIAIAEKSQSLFFEIFIRLENS